MGKGLRASPKLLADLFFSFVKISLFTVGGGPAMIPLVVDLATEKRGWLSESEMMDCLTIAQSLPGGIIVNMATYIGKRVGGIPGMIVAAIGVTFPTAALAVIVGVTLGNLWDSVYVTGAVHGAKAAAAGLVLATFIKMGGSVLKTPAKWAVTAAAMAAVLIFHISVIWVIIAGGLSGWIIYRARRPGPAETPGSGEETPRGGEGE